MTGPHSEHHSQTPPRPGGNRTTILVLSALLVFSTAIGVVSYGQFTASEKALHTDFEAIRAVGARVDVEGCVDEVLGWYDQCDAMKVLCDKSVGRMMEQCLDAGDRSRYCAATDTTSAYNSGFGYKQCEARGAHENRSAKKVCGTAYQAVAYHCSLLRGDGAAPVATGGGPG